MKSTAHVHGHPIHPMLIPYPFALLSSAMVFDVAARVWRRDSWSQTATHLAAAGLATSVLAAVPGIIDYFGSLPRHTRARRKGSQHAVLNVSALACFAAAATRREDGGRLPGTGLAFELLGTGVLAVAGWLGGELVYRHRVAVVDERTLPASDPRRKPLAPLHSPYGRPHGP